MNCVICNGEVAEKINFGLQPPSNRFLKSEDESDEMFPLILGQCHNCALVQLIDPMPEEMCSPRYRWIKYNEPEAHLDELAHTIASLPGVSSESTISGLSYKDDSTIKRLGMIATEKDADVVIARHILEHQRSPLEFLDACFKRAKKYLVLEVPDCSKFMERYDYSFVWEEHRLYFTEETLERLFKRMGIECRVIRYPYPFEDSLVAILRVDPDTMRCALYSSMFQKYSDAYREAIKKIKRDAESVVIFGAGHLSVKFINFYHLEGEIDCVVDDDPNKCGLFMPGSHIPIRHSSTMAGTEFCLSALSPESEKKVAARGLQMASIFPGSPNFFLKGNAP